MPRLLDTNILLRYFTRDDQQRAKAALALLLRVERGEERVSTSPLVVFETIFTLHRIYKVSPERIRELFLPVIALPGLALPNKRLYEEALDIFASTSLSFADAFNVAYMRSQGVTEIYSWDTDFDQVPGIIRVEP